MTKKNDVKLVVFDFDCTLTSFHVFASLAGLVGGIAKKLEVPPPHARTENGQIERLLQLDADPSWGLGVFAFMSFGGSNRVAQIRRLLETLRDRCVECIILSRGMAQPIRNILQQVGLLCFFTQICGSEGCSMGCTAYDHSVQSKSALSGKTGKPGDNGAIVPHAVEQKVRWFAKTSKASELQGFMEERSLTYGEIVYLDDDLEETESARHVCQSIHVTSGHGIGEREINILFDILDRRLNDVKLAPPAHMKLDGF
jgi:phosphoglycolate phosphatase-like HAD superfamily hydrolase